MALRDAQVISSIELKIFWLSESRVSRVIHGRALLRSS